MGLDDGAMPVSTQLREIRETLKGIDEKLDRKVDQEALTPLFRRLERLEEDETPLGRARQQQWEEMRTMLRDLSMHGSANSQLAVNKTAELEVRLSTFEHATGERLDRLERRRFGEDAVEEELDRRERRELTFFEKLMAGATVLVVGAGSVASIVAVVHSLAG